MLLCLGRQQQRHLWAVRSYSVLFMSEALQQCSEAERTEKWRENSVLELMSVYVPKAGFLQLFLV
jgi:hypothetical protein